MTVALLVLAAYLLGAFPTSYVVGRAVKGIDLREHGSGNLGATNAFRVLGWRAASPIFIADILKGFVPAFWFPRLDGMETMPLWALAYGTAAVIGHVFSIFVGFRGGKGVATAAGVFLALAPVAVLGGFLVWAGIVFATGYVSLASVTAAALLPVFVLLAGRDVSVLALAVVLATFVIYAHRTNIRRLLRGEEHRFGRRAAASAKPPGE
ncbi:MAG TPA: glycerol-3-phosphate 1-O-acyltransferase PlsY [Longimicrobiales bacterium]|nr:glycerol-3-phosphate 1-O-acyltransferase PlsY [Longimicrobiales bacterium]